MTVKGFLLLVTNIGTSPTLVFNSIWVVTHPSANQPQPYLASTTRKDYVLSYIAIFEITK